MYVVGFMLLLGGEVNAFLDRAAAELDRERGAALARADQPVDPDLPRWTLGPSEHGG
jgi:hypothetical protein